MTAPITTVSSHNPLTSSDITRLPQGAISATSQTAAPQAAAPQALTEDTFGEQPKESHTLRNTIIGLVIAAAAIVGLKHCKFMQVSDPANMKWYDHPKQWINKLGEWIEKPFVWTYKKLFGKGEGTEEALEKGANGNPKKSHAPKGSKAGAEGAEGAEEVIKKGGKGGSKKAKNHKKAEGSKKPKAKAKAEATVDPKKTKKSKKTDGSEKK